MVEMGIYIIDFQKYNCNSDQLNLECEYPDVKLAS